jgi:hypothetical protein
MVETMAKNRSLIGRVLIVALLGLLFFPFATLPSYSAKTEATTESSTVSASDISDVNVSVATDKNGKTSLSVSGMSGDSDKTWNTIFIKYHSVIIGLSGIAALTFLALFIINLMKVGASAGNPTARSSAIMGCLWTGIAMAGCGSVTIICSIFWNALQG